MPGPALFFTPHQDDEILSMGAAIREHVNDGRDVKVVLCTDGRNSGINVDFPSAAAFIAERDREFVKVVTMLGAEPIIEPTRAEDANLTQAAAAAIIEKYRPQYPDASFKTMSDRDPSGNPDHTNLGRALRASGIADARYYVYNRDGSAQGIAVSQSPAFDLTDELLQYASVGWMSVRPSFLQHLKSGSVRSLYHT